MKDFFAVVFCYSAPSMQSIFGKVGPFDTAEDAEKWCYQFREIARSQDVDMTAIASTTLEQITSEAQNQKFLPSRKPEEIIQRATVDTVLGVLL